MQHIPAQGRDPAIVKLDQEGLPTFESSFGGLSGVKLRVHRLFGGVTEVADLVSPWPLRMKCTATGETLLIQEDTPVDEIGKHVQALNQALIGYVVEHLKSHASIPCINCTNSLVGAQVVCNLLKKKMGDKHTVDGCIFHVVGHCDDADCQLKAKSVLKEFRQNQDSRPKWGCFHSNCLPSRLADLPPTKVCSGCRHNRYCSLACQTADWPTHKSACHALNEARKRAKAQDKATKQQMEAEHAAKGDSSNTG